MERVRRIWWLAFLLPGFAFARGNVGTAIAGFLAILCCMAFVIWVDRRDVRKAAEQAAGHPQA